MTLWLMGIQPTLHRRRMDFSEEFFPSTRFHQEISLFKYDFRQGVRKRLGWVSRKAIFDPRRIPPGTL
jgi:hypothetical protein